ncbi:MAG: aldo/keto reductase [Blastocatellia bacterium]|nr:aldo/keto reductase [Blastocatellia bacterium]
MTLANRATPEGTRRYAERLQATIPREHFRSQQGLSMSTIGLGTYLGHWDERTDQMYQKAIERAIELGVNVIDSAINYRFQRSERAIGAALKRMFDSGKVARDCVIISTKGGFFPFDGEPPRDARRWIMENIIDRGVAGPGDIVGSHCMSPGYLEDQLARSLANLGLDAVDIYYIHNPETQLDAIARDEFLRRVRAAFEFLEEAVGRGRIGMYGTATWNGYRQPPGSRDYLSLEEMVEVARDLKGEDHHFRVIQLPYNLAMTEALMLENQTVDDHQTSLLMAAQRLGMTVMCSASILQSKLARNLPPFIGEALTGLDTDAQRAIQFVRSTPGVTTALVGMAQRSHVEENLKVARIPPAPIGDFFKLFSDDDSEGMKAEG